MPLFWLSLAFLAGLVVAGEMRLAWGMWAALGVLTLLVCRLPCRPLTRLTRRHAALRFPPILLLLAFSLGGLRSELAHRAPGPGELAYYNGSGVVHVIAWVAEPPDQRDTVTLLRLRAEQLTPPDAAANLPVRGDLLAMVPAGQDWQYGDRLELTGQLSAPPENDDFSYRDYLARQGIYSYMAYPRLVHGPGRAGSPLLGAIYALRERAHQVITALFAPPEAPLLDGILLGMDHGLPDALETAFRRTGTSHIIAISGFNMAILAGLFTALFGRLLSRWWAALAALLAITAYTLLVGANPAVMRAAIMSGLSLVAVQIGRSSGGLNALMLAAGLMCLVNPDLPGDVSFQLSFAAALGLLLYASRLEGALRRLAAERLPASWGPWVSWLPALLAENVFFTLIAQAFTLPIIAYHFGRISLVAPLANLLVLPVQSALMVLAGLAVLLGMAWLPLGRLLALPAWALAVYTVRVVDGLGGRPGVEWVIAPGDFFPALGVYLALLALILGGQRIRARLPHVQPALGMVVLAGLALAMWRQALAAPDGRLHLVASNQSGQLVVLLRDPAGQSLLFTGGERASQLSAFLGRWLPPLDRRLDVLLLDNPSRAALNALPDVLARFPPQAAYATQPLPENSAGRTVQQALAERGLPTTPLEAGQTLHLAGNTTLQVEACGEDGCSFSLTMGGFDALILPGDTAPSGAYAVAPDVVLLPTASDETSAAQLVLSPASLSLGSWVHVSTDGKQMWAEEEH
jgi:competence protein ComEC